MQRARPLVQLALPTATGGAATRVRAMCGTSARPGPLAESMPSTSPFRLPHEPEHRRSAGSPSRRAARWLPCVLGLACGAGSSGDVAQVGGHAASAGAVSGSAAAGAGGLPGAGGAGASGVSGAAAAGSTGAAGSGAAGVGGAMAGTGGGSGGTVGKLGCKQPGPCDECLRDFLLEAQCTPPPEVNCLADHGIFSQLALPNLACSCCPEPLCGGIVTAIDCAFTYGHERCCAVCDVLREIVWKDKCAQ